MDLGIKDKVAIVTGGSRGLGRISALALAGEGVKVKVCGRTIETLDKAVGELTGLGVEAKAIVADIVEPGAAEIVFRETERALGPVDILVNNVGGRRGTTVSDTSEEQFRMGMDLNLFRGLRLMHLAIPGMKQRHWGRIINIASIWGREHGASADYMAGKAALIATSKYAGLELVKDNVLVNCVAPGSIIFSGGSWDRYTQSNAPEVVDEFIKWNLPAGRFGWPEPVGDLVAFLASERASLITGACINIDGGQSKSLF